MRSLLIYLKDYKKETILAPLFKMLEASFELFVPLVMAAVIDVGIAGRDKPYIVKMCLVLIALGIIGLVCSITAQYFSAKAAAGFGTGVRHAFFKHIQSFTFTEMDTVGSSTLITRMTSDINQAQSGVNLVLRLFLRSPFIVFGAMVMAFTVDVKAALIFVVVIPLLSVIVFGIMLITMPLYRKVQSNLDSVLLTTRENLAGARVIRAFNKEPDERKRFERENQALTDAQKFVGRISGLMNPLTYIIVNGGRRTCEAGKPHYHCHEGCGVRQPHRECPEDQAGDGKREKTVQSRPYFRRGRLAPCGGIFPCVSYL